MCELLERGVLGMTYMSPVGNPLCFCKSQTLAFTVNLAIQRSACMAKDGRLYHGSFKSEKWPCGAAGDERAENIVSSVKKNRNGRFFFFQQQFESYFARVPFLCC